MSAGDGELPKDVELIRYASGAQVDASRNRVDGAAFKPRPVDAGELSVHRLGVLDSDIEEDLRQLRKIKGEWMTIRRTGRLAQIARTSMEHCASEAKRAFGFKADPLVADGKPNDPTHALVTGIPDGDDDSSVAFRDMLAMRVAQLHLAVED